MAASAICEVLFLSRAQTWATTAAQHIEALARHQALNDRPIRDPIYDLLREGETIQQFRRRWRLRTVELIFLNPGIDFDNLHPSTPLCVWRYDPGNPPRSYYRPNRGRLQNGELMPLGEGWVVREDRFAFGTHRTINGLIHAIHEVLEQHPDGQDLMVADISSRNGGRLNPHRSHQSGRDVDVTYYRHQEGEPTFSRARLNELDLERTWTFVRTLLVDHDIEYMFMSRPIQEALFRHAESLGEHPAFLEEVFQYGPRRHRNSRAVVRFSRGHHDHVHIRFECGPNDFRCRAAR